MKWRSVLPLFCLIACMCASFVVAESFAGQSDLDEITKALRQKNSRWSAKHTSFSRLTPEARKNRLGSKYPLPSFTERTLSGASASLPLRLDWRNYNGSNYVTPVKEQGECGGCWAFAVTAALESKALISQNTPGILIDLSEQMLISCSGVGTCAAGAINAASDFISNYGLPPESCNPYTGMDSLCENSCPDWEADAYRIGGWSLVKPTVESIKYALYNHGPLVTLQVCGAVRRHGRGERVLLHAGEVL